VPKILLLEHDNRFAVFKDEFVFYDFMQPVRLPGRPRPPTFLVPHLHHLPPLFPFPPVLSQPHFRPSSSLTFLSSTPKRHSRPPDSRPSLPLRRLPDQGRPDGAVAPETFP